MIARRSLLFLPALLAAPALLEGCASAAAPQVLHLTIHGGANQNPDPAGHPAPVAIRLFQLAATGRFKRADVFTLIGHEKQTLGPDLLGSEEFVISPGASLSITRTLQKGTQFVGLAVLFRDIDHAQWRASAPVAASGPTTLTVRVSGTKATLS